MLSETVVEYKQEVKLGVNHLKYIKLLKYSLARNRYAYIYDYGYVMCRSVEILNQLPGTYFHHSCPAFAPKSTFVYIQRVSIFN